MSQPKAKPATTSFPAPEVELTPKKRVMCDGGGGALGHPRVYYDIGPEGYVDCLYCDKRFVLKGGPADK